MMHGPINIKYMILFVTSGDFQAVLAILTYLKEDVTDSPAVWYPVLLSVYANYCYRSYYYYYYYHHHHYGKKKSRGPRSGKEV